MKPINIYRSLLVLVFAALLVCVTNAQAQYGNTVTAFKTGERVTGTTKQCYYKWASNQYTRTIRSYEICPMSIQVRL